MTMTRRQRLEATLTGDVVDRPAVSMWQHFYDLEQTVDGLVQAMLDFQHRFDWDFMKVNPRACYHVQDWGNRYDFSPAPQAGPDLVDHRVKGPDDWAGLPVLNPSEGVLGEHIQALGMIRQQLDPDVPMIMTEAQDRPGADHRDLRALRRPGVCRGRRRHFLRHHAVGHDRQADDGPVRRVQPALRRADHEPDTREGLAQRPARL